jgi:hypothetical protein
MAGLLKAAQFGNLLKNRGVLTALRFCTSAAHTQRDVAETLERAEGAMRELKESGSWLRPRSFTLISVSKAWTSEPGYLIKYSISQEDNG